MTRPMRTRARAVLEAAAGAAWIGAVAIAATETFKSKKSPATGAPPPPPPANSAPPPPPPPRRRSPRRQRRWMTPVIATVVAAALGLPGASFGLGLLSGEADEAPRFRAVSAGVETSQSAKGLMRFRRQVFEIRPSPSPTPPPPPPEPEPEVAEVAAPAPPPPPAPAGSVVAIIHAAAARHGVSGDWMVSIAQCESGLNPRAVNPAGYYGLFQFSRSTWAAYGSGDIFDAAAQSEATAKMLANGGAGHWPNCS